jgi:4-hydroxy-2-oxoheptanedioate aldolase
MKLLDLGAYGVIAPMVQNAEDARRFASALRYSPLGERSFGPRRPSLRYGASYVERASDTIVGLAMIETRRALENLDDILAVDGLDGVFIGPSDLALDMGFVPKVDSEQPEVVSAIASVRAKAHAASKRAGIFCGGGAFARRKLQEGFDFVSVGTDLTLLTAGARAAIAEARYGLEES